MAESAREAESKQREEAQISETKAKDAADAERRAKEQAEKATEKALAAAELERKANAESLKRLKQITKSNQLLGSLFNDLNLLLIQQKLDVLNSGPIGMPGFGMGLGMPGFGMGMGMGMPGGMGMGGWAARGNHRLWTRRCSAN